MKSESKRGTFFLRGSGDGNAMNKTISTKIVAPLPKILCRARISGQASSPGNRLHNSCSLLEARIDPEQSGMLGSRSQLLLKRGASPGLISIVTTHSYFSVTKVVR